MNGVKLILLLFMLPICTSILAQQQNGDYIYHYSVMDGMRNGIYKGEHHVAHLAKKGDFGLGTYNLLDGEMIVKDGVFYRIRSDGSIKKQVQQANRLLIPLPILKQTQLSYLRSRAILANCKAIFYRCCPRKTCLTLSR